MNLPLRPRFRTAPPRGGALAEWLRAELEVLEVLAEAPGLAEAAPRLFEVIGAGLKTDVGVLWLIEQRTGLLRSAYVWRARGANAPEYEVGVRRAALARGESLAGAAWAGMTPVVRPTRASDADDPIAVAARTDALRFGIAFPIRFGEEFHGVVELAARKGRRNTADTTIAVRVLGEMFGQFLVRQGALRRLGTSERHLAELFANAPLGLMVADPKGRVLRANQTELEMLGYAADAYVGHLLSEFHLDRAALDDLLSRVARGEEVRGFETRVRRGDGTEAWIRLHANGSFEGARLQQVRCFSRDVSEEKEAERALRDREERLRLLVEGARDYALHTYDAKGRVSAWSLGAQHLFGWEDAEAVGIEISSLFGPEDRADDVPSRLVQLAQDEGRLLHEGWLLRKDGSRFWANVSLTAVRDPEGRVTHVCQLTRDATESRRIEVFRRRTAEIEAANRAVLLAERRTAETLEGLRSELEAPVQAIERIVGRLEAADAQDSKRTVRAYATALRRALDRAATDGAAAPPSGGARLEPLDPFRLASEVRDMLRDAAAERRIRVEVDVESDVGSIHVDPDLLRQVLFNLVSNAIRFNRDRGRVSVRFLKEGSAAFRVEVEDTGIGIPDGRVGALFDEISAATGNGAVRRVGLLATRRLVTDLGGRVAVRSAVGRGSIFSVILPTAPAAATPPPEASAASRGASGYRVVVVEPDPAVRASLAWTLGGVGYDVAAVAGAMDAQDAAGERGCDVLVAGLDGEGAALVDLVEGLHARPTGRRPAHVIGLVHGEDGPPGALLVSDVVARPAPADRLFAALERAGVPRGPARPLLLVEGDLAVMDATTRVLQALDYRVVAEPDADAALRAASHEPPSAVLLSPFPLVLDAFQFPHHLRRIPGLRHVPTVLCAPREPSPQQVTALRAAAGRPVSQLARVLTELDHRLLVIRAEAATEASKA